MEIDHSNDFLAQHLGNLLSRQPVAEPKVFSGSRSDCRSDSSSVRAEASSQGSVNEAGDELTRLVISATRNQLAREQAAAELESINQGRRLAAQRSQRLQRRCHEVKSDAAKGHRRTASEWVNAAESPGARSSTSAQSDAGPSSRGRNDRSSESEPLYPQRAPVEGSQGSSRHVKVSSKEPEAGEVHARDFAVENAASGIEGPLEEEAIKSPAGSPCVQWPDPFELIAKKGVSSIPSSVSDGRREGAKLGPRHTSMQTKPPPPANFVSRMRLFGDRSSAGRDPMADILAPPRAFSSGGGSSDRASSASHQTDSVHSIEELQPHADGEDAIRAQISTGATASASSSARPPQPAKRLRLVAVGDDGRSFRFVETPTQEGSSEGWSDAQSVQPECPEARTASSSTADAAAPSDSGADNHMSRSTSLGSLPSTKRNSSAGMYQSPERSRSTTKTTTTTEPNASRNDATTRSFTFGSRAGGFSVSYGSFRASTRKERPGPIARATRSEAAARRSPSRDSSPVGERQRRSSKDTVIEEAPDRRRQSEPSYGAGQTGSSHSPDLDPSILSEEQAAESSPDTGSPESRSSPSPVAFPSSTSLGPNRLGLHSCGGRSVGGSGVGSSLGGTSTSSPTNGSQSALANSEANDSEDSELTSISEGSSPRESPACNDEEAGQASGPILERSSTLRTKKLGASSSERQPESFEGNRIEAGDGDEELTEVVA